MMKTTVAVVMAVSQAVMMMERVVGRDEGERDTGRMNLAFTMTFSKMNSGKGERYYNGDFFPHTLICGGMSE